MIKIVGIIHPFDLKQTFYVYQDGNKLTATQIKIDEINDTVFAWREEYKVQQIDLVGSKQYNRGLAKKIKEAEMAKYNKNTFTINVV